MLKIIQSVVASETSLIANLANTCAVIMQEKKYHWVGFYLVEGGELVLGPFQGPLACTRIAFGKGVCGTAWEKRKSLVVANVHEFAGHIACSAETNSELVVPVIKDGSVVAVLDLDSKDFNTFGESEVAEFEAICSFLTSSF